MIKFNLGLALLLWTVLAFGQNQDDRLYNLEAEIDSIMQTYHTAGMSIAIVENDEVIYSQGLGFRNLSQKLPVNANTLFPIGSVSKPLTASLIGVYQASERLNLNDKPQKHIKSLRFYSDEMNHLITIADLLSHRSGIGVVDGTHVFFPTNDLDLHLQRLVHLKPNSSVRERFDYSNMGYAILGGITEKISGKSWAENLKAEIFEPLEMYRSNTNLKDLQADENYALGYSIANDEIVKVEYEDQHESVASGAVNSTATELANWVRMLLNRGKYNEQQILAEAYLARSFSEQNIIRGSFSFDQKNDLLADTYGYGWFVNQYQGLYRVHHEGNVSGFTASVNLYPYKNIGIIILANQGGANSLTKAINEIILKRLLRIERKKWQDYPIQIGEARMVNDTLKPINEEKRPTHPLSAYCGKYKSEGYGVVEVLFESGNLNIQFPAFKMGLEHQHYNTFINKVITVTHQNTPSFYINFPPNNEGNISELTIGFSAEGERFEKIE
ncbi:MAG: serine hydrolase [Bacteroidia bacterium]